MTTRKINELVTFVLSYLRNELLPSLNDYLITVQNNSTNLVLTKDIANRTLYDLEKLLETEVPETLDKIIPSSGVVFGGMYYTRLKDLKDANYGDYSSQYSVLISILTDLIATIENNIKSLSAIQEIIAPFIGKDYSSYQGNHNAIFAIVLNNVNSYKDLKSLNSELKRWEIGLRVYQQIISSSAPEELSIVEVSEGSVELLISLDFDIVSNLIELFTKGLEAYSAYLAYKSAKEELTKLFRGNKDLIAGEESQEKLMLENIKRAVIQELEKQSKESEQSDTEAIDKKVDVVSKLVTDQIIKGNDLKLISAPSEEAEIEILEKRREKLFLESERIFKSLDEASRQKLISQYSSPENGADTE